VIERLRGELVNREEQVARLKRERMLAMEGRTVHGGWSDVGNKP